MNRRIALLLLIILPVIFSCTEKEPEVEQVIRVESVSVSQNSAALTIGETLQLTASVSPASATNKNISWSSSNQAIASVSASGLVTAVGEGSATITASAGGKQGSCTVSVSKGHVAVAKVELNKTEQSLYEGEEVVLTATVQPEDATDKTISWSSSNASIVTVEDGKIKALKEGKATITAKADGKETYCTVSVLPRISLNTAELELTIDDTETMNATLAPSDAGKKVTWSSSDSKVAKVEDGKITALAVGSATISASLDGYKAECVVTVKGLDYQAVSITDLKPVDILPIIGQVTNGDKESYNHIEHLRLAEATRIIDMMWEYGAGSHSKAEYQQLMGRLNTGMLSEIPLAYDNYHIVGPEEGRAEPNEHGHALWSILCSLVKHANFVVVPHYSVSYIQEEKVLHDYLQTQPNTINIFGKSHDSFIRLHEHFLPFESEFRKYFDSGNLLLFIAGTNIDHWEDDLVNKIVNGAYVADNNGIYSEASFANSDKNRWPDYPVMVTIGTNATGNVDQTGETREGSKFPVGFADNVLFSGRDFPFHSVILSGISAQSGKYATSPTTYVNVAMSDLCFQMYAEVADVKQLIEMIRSTCLTDYIRLDGQTQPLQLINPAGLYKKYLTPQNLPESIATGETLDLEKGYYKGVIFSIPGAEVKINGQWVAFDAKNKDTILSKNPMNLEWRLDGERLQKYGYTSGQTIEGQIITVDDKWGGLRLEVPMTIKIQ